VNPIALHKPAQTLDGVVRLGGDYPLRHQVVDFDGHMSVTSLRD
jgi:hypothetical protein